MIAIDLSKQQALDADPRAIQQINFTESFSLLKKQKKLFWTLLYNNFNSSNIK